MLISAICDADSLLVPQSPSTMLRSRGCKALMNSAQACASAEFVRWFPGCSRSLGCVGLLQRLPLPLALGAAAAVGSKAVLFLAGMRQRAEYPRTSDAAASCVCPGHFKWCLWITWFQSVCCVLCTWRCVSRTGSLFPETTSSACCLEKFYLIGRKLI